MASQIAGFVGSGVDLATSEFLLLRRSDPALLYILLAQVELRLGAPIAAPAVPAATAVLEALQADNPQAAELAAAIAASLAAEPTESSAEALSAEQSEKVLHIDLRIPAVAHIRNVDPQVILSQVLLLVSVYGCEAAAAEKALRSTEWSVERAAVALL